MKKVEAYIRHEAFEPIREDLLRQGFPSLSIMEVKGSGRQKGIVERYRGRGADQLPPPQGQDRVRRGDGGRRHASWRRSCDHARTGAIGDGKVFVVPVEQAYRIRTGESGEETLQAHPDVAAERVA